MGITVLVHYIYPTNYFCVVSVCTQIMAEVPNPTVGRQLLEEIFCWRTQGIGFSDIISRTVPPRFTYCSWRPVSQLHGYTSGLIESVSVTLIHVTH